MTSRRPGAPRSARRPVSASGTRRGSGRPASRPAAPASRGGPSRRTSTRGPAAASRPRSTSARTTAQDGPGITITRRTLVLVTLVVVALAALVPTVNSYVAQRQQLAELRSQVEGQEQEVEDLRQQVDRWEDPAYVTARARERLLFAMPGETQYRLTDTSGREVPLRSEEHTSELQSRGHLVCRLLLEKKKKKSQARHAA